MTMIAVSGFEFGSRGMITSHSNGAGGDIGTTTDTPYSYGRAGSGNGFGSSLTMVYTSHQEVVAGFSYKPASGNPQSSVDIFNFTDNATVQVHVVLDMTNRRVTVYRGSGTSNQLAQSAINSIPPYDNFSYLEFKCKIDNSTGTVEVRCDNITICSASGIDTQVSANATSDRLVTGVPVNWRIDDYYVLNTSGSTNNDFLGRQRVMVEFPVAEDSPIDFTPSSGSDNALMVDDGFGASNDGDSTYNSLAAATGKDLFTVTGDIPSATVNAMLLRSVLRKTDAATCTARALYVTSGADQVGATQNPGTSYGAAFDLFDQDTTDSSNWTQSKINSIKIGYERLS